MRRTASVLGACLLGASLLTTPTAQADHAGPAPERWPPKTVHVDPDELPSGPLPKVPYYHEGTEMLHDGDRAIEVDLPRDGDNGSSGYHGVYPVRGGYVVRTRQYHIHPRLFFVRYDGSRHRVGGLVHGLERLNVVVGAGRGRIAYIRFRGGTGDQLVEVRRVRDDKLIARRELGQGPNFPLDLLAMRDGKVWFADGYGVRVRRWNLATGKVRTFAAPRRGRGGLRADLSARRVVIDRGHKRCVDVVTIPKRKQKRWRSCRGVRPIAWSPNDRYVVGFDNRSTAVVRRSRSGKPVIRFTGLAQGGPLPEVIWESNNTFIADAYVGSGWDTEVALVRCTIRGECEQIARWETDRNDEQLSVAVQNPS